MPKQIFDYHDKEKEKITKILWSNDWFSFTPWQHNEVIVPYFKYIQEDVKNSVKMSYFYIGPLAVMIGTWIKNEEKENA